MSFIYIILAVEVSETDHIDYSTETRMVQLVPELVKIGNCLWGLCTYVCRYVEDQP